MINLFSHYIPSRSLVLAALEAAVLLIAAQIGMSLELTGSHAATYNGAALFSEASAFALGMIIIMSSMGLYQADLWHDLHSVSLRVLIAFAAVFAIVGLIAYVMPTRYPGLVALGATTMALALTGSLCVRAAFHRWQNLTAFKSRVLVLGTGSRVTRLAERGGRNPHLEVVGYIPTQPALQHYVPSSLLLPTGPGDSLLSVAERHAIDQIVVGVRDRRNGGLPLQELLECKMKGIQVIELPTFFEREYRQVMLESLNPSWMVLGDGFRQGVFRNTAKRLFDLVMSTVLLLACLPVLLVAMICIYLESGAPVLYRQERVGRGGRVFTLYKLRSMRQDAESNGTPQWAAADDDRTTRVGRFLRKTRIDELPQIFNVLKGEMSFVGPRPERPVFVDELVKQIPFYALRHTVTPGITGWAQVRYSYGASVDESAEKLQYDLYYVKNNSLFLDIMIMIATVEVVLWGKGAR